MFVSLDEARADEGLRLVVSGIVPSPWSEAAKGVIKLAGLPVKIVRHTMADAAAINAWTGTDNVPVLLSGKEPARTAANAIVGHLARLAPGKIVSLDPRERASTMGLVELVAGEGGLGWTARLFSIDAGLSTNGTLGFSARAAAYLAPRYGYDAHSREAIVPTFEKLVAVLDERLGSAAFFGGETPDALDVYVAAFLTILTPLDESSCVGISERWRAGFAYGAEKLGPLVPKSLFALRRRMFERVLDWPIQV